MAAGQDGKILVLTTGGTLDKIYFDANSRFEVGTSIVGRLLEQASVRAGYEVVELMRKDSLDLTDEDRARIRAAIEVSPHRRVVVTHGTDTMTDTAACLAGMDHKVVVLTGALAPARFAESDAMFNLGMAFAAAQILDTGIYIAMNGKIFVAGSVRKDRELRAFVEVPPDSR